MKDFYKAVCDEWQEKTEWVKQTATCQELGMHRADILKQRIIKLEARLEAAYDHITELYYLQEDKDI